MLRGIKVAFICCECSSGDGEGETDISAYE